jgi:hypothetical protein
MWELGWRPADAGKYWRTSWGGRAREQRWSAAMDGAPRWRRLGLGAVTRTERRGGGTRGLATISAQMKKSAREGREQGTRGIKGGSEIHPLVNTGGSCRALVVSVSCSRWQSDFGCPFLASSAWIRISVAAQNILLDVYSTNLVQDLR